MQDDIIGNSELAQKLGEVLSIFVTEVMRSSADDLLRLMRREDLSMPRVVALLFVQRLGSCSITDINEHLNLSLGTTSHLVDQLVCGAYVSRSEDPNDRRHKQVILTGKGQAFVDEFRRARVDYVARRMAHLPAPLIEAAVAVMADVNEYLRSEPSGTSPRSGEPKAT